MSELLNVTIAPYSMVALIATPDGELYSLANNGVARKEKNPSRFKLELDESSHTVKIEDEYPFLKVQRELRQDILRGRTVSLCVKSMDKELPDELRKDAAQVASLIAENYPETMAFARKMLLLIELPEEAEIKKEILDVYSQEFQKLFQEIQEKWRPQEL
jgi:hypothetical protein